MQYSRAHAPSSYLLAGDLIELRRIMFYVYGNSVGRKALLTITHVSHADRRAVLALHSRSALYDRTTRAAIGNLRSVHGLAALTSRRQRREKRRGIN